jgi:hypothetical protein
MLQSSWKRSGWLSLGPKQVYYKRNRIEAAKEIRTWAFIIVQAEVNEENSEQVISHPWGPKTAETCTLESSSASS